MPQLRVALAQVDTTVGDLAANAALVLRWSGAAAAAGAHLVVFPEMTLTGYMPEDLVLRSSFRAASEAALQRLAADLDAAGLGTTAVVVGHCGAAVEPVEQVGRPVGSPQNSLAVCWGGEVVARYAKHHLPNYGVFDEARWFVPGHAFPVLRLHGVDVGLTICEDLWQQGGPIAVARAARVGLVLCANASPYEEGKLDQRTALVAERAVEAGAPIAYVNLVGGQDEVVYDGGSFVVDAEGALVARGPQFTEGCLLMDIDCAAAGVVPTPNEVDGMTTVFVELSTQPLPGWEPLVPDVTAPLQDEEEVWRALVLALRDYVDKNGFAAVALGLSGGIDSAVTATLAVDALGGARVHTVAMPSSYSSPHSLADAADLAARQGTQHRVVQVAPMVAAYQDALHLSGLAEENLQARVRGTLLMAISNAEGPLVLTTGNKSELATGFSTLYGDSAGGFAPLRDVPKTLVWRLARWRNTDAEARGELPPIPQASIDKPPSAELAPGQLDSDRLPDYEALDAVLDDYVEGDLGRDALIAAGHDAALVDRVLRLVDLAEYKRRQNPPGPKLSTRSFGRERRLPITSHWRETPLAPDVEPVIRPEHASTSGAMA